MEEFEGLFPLLFASINSFILINLFIFARKNKKAKYVYFLSFSLLISQFSEFLVCFIDLSSPVLIYLNILGVWLFPIFTVILIAYIAGYPDRFLMIYYLLSVVVAIMLITNYGEMQNSCSLFINQIRYPSQWLLPYFTFGGLILAGIKLNSSIKNITDELEIKKRRILLFSILATLSLTLILLLLVSDLTLLDSIWGKTGVIINLGAAYYVIRDRYQVDGK